MRTVCKAIGFLFLGLTCALTATAASAQSGGKPPIEFDPNKMLFDAPSGYQYHPSQRLGNVHPSIREYGPQGENGPGHPQYDEKFGPSGKPGMKHPSYPMEKVRTTDWSRKSRGRTVPDAVTVSLVNSPEGRADEVALRLSVPKYTQSCYELGPLEYEKSISDKIYLDVEVIGYTVTETGECGTFRESPAAVIPLTREDMKDIRTVRLRSGYTIDRYGVTLDPDGLALTPDPDVRLFQPARDPRQTDPLRRSFLPAGTVVLFVPAAAPERSYEQEVEALAASLALTPIRQVEPDFAPGSTEPGLYYFVDNSGRYAQNLGEDAQEIAGTIRPFHATTSAAATGRLGGGPLDVYVRRPRDYE